MPRFAANLTVMFNEAPLLDRFDLAAEAGFDAVELLFPYDNAVRELTTALARNGLTFVLFNTPPPNWAGGDRGFAAVPGGQDRFRHDFRRALRYVEALRPRHLHVMAGLAEGDAARSIYVENLRWAAAEAPGVSLTIEVINPIDMPGYFLDDYDLAAEVLDTVAAPNLSLQFDAYHAHRITGDVFATWTAHRDRIRHIQVAGFPGRHEPMGGEIDYPAFFAALDASGYDGYVSGEYTPAGKTAAGLAWMR